MSEQLQALVIKGAHVVDAAQQEFDQMVTDFWIEQEDQQEDMGKLHADRVDPWSIDRIVEDSIASQFRSINSNVEGVLSSLALIVVAQKKTTVVFDAAIASQNSQFDELTAQLTAALNNQHSQLMKLVAGNTMRDAQLAKHS